MVISMPRPKWTPEAATDEQKKLIEAVQHAFKQGKQWERHGYAAIRAAQAIGVPMEYLVSRTPHSQATIYRHLNEPDDGVEREPAILAELSPETRLAVERELAEGDWTTQDFLLASLTMLTRNPEQYLKRLGEVYPKRRKEQQ